MKSIKGKLLIVPLAAVGIVAGLVGGAAFASTPAPLEAREVLPTNVAGPPYPVNESGQTYGSSLTSPTKEDEPELILAVATNGKTGYYYAAEVEAWGTGFKSPEEALAWQEANKGVEHTVNVYLSDGKTVIGEFVISNTPGYESHTDK